MRMPAVAVFVMALLAAGCSGHEGSPTVEPSVAVTTQATPTPAPTTASPTPESSATVSPTPDELSPKPGLESAPPTGLPTCKGSALSVTDADTLVSPTNREEVYTIRTSGPNCQLSGYPTVGFRDAAGRAIAIKTQHGGYGLPTDPPATMTISRSTSLSFVIASSRDGVCREVATLLVTLPMTTGPHTVPTQLRPCGTTVGLSPVERRTDIH